MKNFKLLLLSFVIAGCVTEFDTTNLQIPEVYVLNSLISPDTLFSCAIDIAGKPTDIYYKFVENADVSIYNAENNALICKLNHTDSGRYVAQSTRPVVGASYRIEAIIPNKTILKGQTSIPDKATPTRAYGHFSGVGINEHSYYYNGYLEFTDIAAAEYYEIEIREYSNHRQHFNFTGSDDEILRKYNAFIYEGRGFVLLHDEFFKNQSHLFRFQFEKPGIDSTPVYMVVRSISSEYYNFLKFWLKHKQEETFNLNILNPAQGLLGMFYTPISIYSNIEGGTGIFAGYNTTVFLSDNM